MSLLKVLTKVNGDVRAFRLTLTGYQLGAILFVNVVGFAILWRGIGDVREWQKGQDRIARVVKQLMDGGKR